METQNDSLDGYPVSFSVNKFKFNFNFNPFTTSIVIGCCSCGKTSFVINKIYRDICDKIDNLYVFTNKHDSNMTLYNQITDNVFEFKDFEYIYSFIKSDNEKNNTTSLIILDDISMNISKNMAIQDLIYNGRHSKITTIIINQIMPYLNKELTPQIDYFVITKQINNNILKSLYEKYFGIFPCLQSYINFNKILDIYDFFIFNTRLNSNNKGISIHKTKLFNTHKKILTNININKNKMNEMYDIQKKEPDKNNYKEILNELNDTIDKLVGLRTKLKNTMIE